MWSGATGLQGHYCATVLHSFEMPRVWPGATGSKGLQVTGGTTVLYSYERPPVWPDPREGRWNYDDTDEQ